MNWAGPAMVLSSRAHGEGAALVQVFTREYGRYAGLVHGRRTKGAALQPGALVEARWRARLSDHLGIFTLELVTARTVTALDDRMALAGLSAACAIAESALPERDPHAAIYDGLALVFSHLNDRAIWPALYVRWEWGLLAELGFGVRFERVGAFSSNPPSLWEGARGRASGGDDCPSSVQIPLPNPLPKGEGIQMNEAQEMIVGDGVREFSVPRFLVGGGNAPDWADIAQGLALTGHFLEARLYAAHNKALPDARARLMDEARRLAKAAPSA